VASRAEFDVEEIEDLRLAVDELCISVIQGSSDGRLDLQFSRDNHEIEVSCQYHGVLASVPVPSDDLLDGLSARILDALVDEHGRNKKDGRRQAWLRKRRAQRSG
jgi:anti-sigma regulatory factor (Ser/Thr protein kinase)